MAKVNPDKCLGCGGCVNACPHDSMRLKGSCVVITNCQHCGICVPVCPVGALKPDK